MDNHPIPYDNQAPEVVRPANLEAERAVLGSIMLDADLSMDEIALRKFTRDAFSQPAHRKIFQVMEELHEDGKPIELVTIMSKINDYGWEQATGGILYITKLSDIIPSAASIGHYIDLVMQKYLQWQLIKTSNRINDQAHTADDPMQVIESARKQLDDMAGQTIRKGFRSTAEIGQEYFEELEERYNNRDGTGVTGIPSGFDDLDRMTAGFQPSDLIVIAARPSVGKTALALNIARNAAALTQRPIGVFSLEMAEKQLFGRELSAEGNLDGGKLRSAHLHSTDWETVVNAIGQLSAYPIYIDDTPGITLGEIRAKSRKLKKDKGLGMILIDYLQLIEVPYRAGWNRQQEVSEISRTLKQIARELEVPVIALSQLSRSVEQRQDKRPMLSDLRESGSIEQDADIVAFLYRDDYYDKETEKKDLIEIIIAKQRNGQVGTVELAYLKNFNKFLSIERTHSKYEHQQGESYKKPDMYAK